MVRGSDDDVRRLRQRREELERRLVERRKLMNEKPSEGFSSVKTSVEVKEVDVEEEESTEDVDLEEEMEEEGDELFDDFEDDDDEYFEEEEEAEEEEFDEDEVERIRDTLERSRDRYEPVFRGFNPFPILITIPVVMVVGWFVYSVMKDLIPELSGALSVASHNVTTVVNGSVAAVASGSTSIGGGIGGLVFSMVAVIIMFITLNTLLK